MTEEPIDGTTLDGAAATCLWTLRNRAEESRHPGSAFTSALDQAWLEIPDPGRAVFILTVSEASLPTFAEPG